VKDTARGFAAIDFGTSNSAIALPNFVAMEHRAREASVKFGAVEGGEQTLARLDQYLAATPVKGSPPR